jgi:hypothetical protein
MNNVAEIRVECEYKITIIGTLSVPVLIYSCSTFNWSLEEIKKLREN